MEANANANTSFTTPQSTRRKRYLGQYPLVSRKRKILTEIEGNNQSNDQPWLRRSPRLHHKANKQTGLNSPMQYSAQQSNGDNRHGRMTNLQQNTSTPKKCPSQNIVSLHRQLLHQQWRMFTRSTITDSKMN